MRQLAVMRLEGNTLTGSIPAELGNLSNVVQITLNYNAIYDETTGEFTGGLTGPIPAGLGDIPDLRRLELRGNRLTGRIPPKLGNALGLDFLSLGINQLSGPIPTELGNLSNLAALLLDDNQLSGPIPTELGNLSNLWYLYLQRNQLTGPIPTELGNLSNLKMLILYDNQLSGPIPAEIGQLSNLQYLHLYDNQLSGKLPSSLAGLSLEATNGFFAGGSGACLSESDSDLQSWFQTYQDITAPYATLRGCIPLAPELSLSRDGKQVTVSWTPQRESLPIQDYLLQWKSGDEDYTAAGQMVTTDASETVTGLEDGVAYTFRVRGRNDEGDGTWTEAEAEAPEPAGEPLTASFHNVPERQDARSPFSFDLRFSENFGGRLRYKMLRDEALQVTNGKVTHARRKAQNQNQNWIITVRPRSGGDVTVSLVASGDCATAPAICTPDGRALSNTPSVTLVGEPLTASFHNVPERQDATSPFSFDLRFSENFGGRLRYKMLRDEALQVTNGKVTHARRKAQNQNQNWIITVRPRSGGDVTVSLVTSGDCATAPAICTPDGRALSNTPSVTWPSSR